MHIIFAAPSQISCTVEEINTQCYVRYRVFGMCFSELISIQNLSLNDNIVSHITILPAKEEWTNYVNVFLKEGYTPDDIEYCTQVLSNIFIKIIKVLPEFRPDAMYIDWTKKGYKEHADIREFSNSLVSYLLSEVQLSETNKLFISTLDDEDHKLVYSCIFSIISIKNDFIKFLYLYQILHLLVGGSQNSVQSKICELNKKYKYNINTNVTWKEIGKSKQQRQGDFLTYLRNQCAHCVDVFNPEMNSNLFSSASMIKITELERELNLNLTILLKVIFNVFDEADSAQVIYPRQSRGLEMAGTAQSG